jgi:hypothetical protein
MIRVLDRYQKHQYQKPHPLNCLIYCKYTSVGKPPKPTAKARRKPYRGGIIVGVIQHRLSPMFDTKNCGIERDFEYKAIVIDKGSLCGRVKDSVDDALGIEGSDIIDSIDPLLCCLCEPL